MISYIHAFEVWGSERAGIGSDEVIALADSGDGLVLLEVTAAAVRPARVLHLVRRTSRPGGGFAYTPLAEGFVPIDPKAPGLRVLGFVASTPQHGKEGLPGSLTVA